MAQLPHRPGPVGGHLQPGVGGTGERQVGVQVEQVAADVRARLGHRQRQSGHPGDPVGDVGQRRRPAVENDFRDHEPHRRRLRAVNDPSGQRPPPSLGASGSGPRPLLALDLSFIHERAQTGRRSNRGGAACSQLSVHPGDDPWGCHVAGVGDVHAAGRARDNRARPRGFDESAHCRGRFATLAGTMARGVELFQGDFVNPFDLVVNNHVTGCHYCSPTPLARPRSRNYPTCHRRWRVRLHRTFSRSRL